METEEKIRVLVVDDSAFMRSAIKGMLQIDPQLQVIATARDGEEAIEKIRQYKPDIVTMDIEMPRMDGLTATRIIMKEMPVPILIVSSLSEEGAQVTFDALEAGAVDFISKDLGNRSLNILNIEQDIIAKIKTIFHRKKDFGRFMERFRQSQIVPVDTRLAPLGGGNVLLVAIGVSTGGPKALHDVIPYLPKGLSAAVAVVQHMPAAFTKSFADRLNDISALEVQEAQDGLVVRPGMALVAPGGRHMRFRRRNLEVTVEISDIPRDSLHKPSANEMMLSAVKTYGASRVLGVIMTGMGNDGLLGMRAIKSGGGKTIAQDEASCVVYGMPKAVVDEGLANKVVPLEQLANEIVNMV
ncbi:MAG TPA: chemotaxis response regulator protein-glutamate methylesterase [Elusimicrobiota bacterium]|nr:chemotaxis response regulator protein-glutamate methylesterase [Elusimicrobiota bacterium]